MEQTEQQGLFDSKLNESGKIYIRKFATAARLLILIGVLISLLSLTMGILWLVKTHPADLFNDKLERLFYKVFPYYLFVYAVLALLQLHAFWNMSKYLSKGADYNDEVSFNESFRYLYRNTVFGAISLALGLLLSSLELYLFVKDYIV